MPLDSGTLKTAYIAFNAAFQIGLDSAAPDWDKVATPVPSTTGSEEYSWLGKWPNIREWIGDRHVNKLKSYNYTVKNKNYESTVEVDRNDFEDNKHGIYAPMFTELGRQVAGHPDRLVFNLLKNGFGNTCYDGQYFFDTDHPVIAEDGTATTFANTDGGSGTPWFLLDTSRALKPIIYQKRKDFNLVSKDKETDDNVFSRRQFLYGVDGRSNVGYGFWQMAWGSKQTLSKTTYALGRETLMGQKGDYGQPLAIMPRLLVVPPSLEGEALEILNAERDAAGATNVYRNTATLLGSGLIH